jgi:hypothetical protein
MSRSGATMAAGLPAGLSNEDAARCALFGIQRLPCRALSDALHRTNRLTPFADYCVTAGVAASLNLALT